MANRKTYHVTATDDNRWSVKKEGADRASSVHDNKSDAVDRARDLAKGTEPSQVIIHKKDGKIQNERTYKDDPHPPKG